MHHKLFGELTSYRVQRLFYVFNILIFLMQKIHDAMNKPGVSAKLKEVLGKVSAYDNVPRKKAKFQVGKISFYSICFIFCFFLNNDYFAFPFIF